jgi:hypothetical protein
MAAYTSGMGIMAAIMRILIAGMRLTEGVSIIRMGGITGIER